jgi:septation ring formation regulator EzrA
VVQFLHPEPDAMTTNYTATIPHHANYIWDALNRDNTVSTDTFAWVAEDLEKAETCADCYRFSEAVHWILCAARQVFGVYSEKYAELVSFYSA